MNSKFYYILFLLGLFSVQLMAQSAFTNGWLPKVNVSAKITDNIKWVNSVESREIIYKEKLQFSHSLIDVTSVLSYKTDVNQSLNIGYVARFKKGVVTHRFLQHYNLISTLEIGKLAHRFGFEQFYKKDKKPNYRSRYRLALLKSLEGEKVDIKEWYIKITNEYLYQFNKEDFEVRLSPYLGYKLSKRDKLEFGLDYRLGKLLDSYQKNSLWFRTTWYISL